MQAVSTGWNAAHEAGVPSCYNAKGYPRGIKITEGLKRSLIVVLLALSLV